MIISKMKDIRCVNKGLLHFNILKSGDIFDITYENNQLNVLRGNLIDGSFFNVYLRIFENETYEYTRLIGRMSPGRYQVSDNKIIYQGEFKEIRYQVIITVLESTFTVDCLLDGNKKNVDLFFGTDIAIAPKGAVLSSEAYTAQYIDHHVFEDSSGYTILSRQNQGMPQVLQIGSINKTVGYVTDGTQFYGLSYKGDNKITALNEKRLISKNYQYEFAYIVLQSETVNLNGKHSFGFYGLYEPDHKEIIDSKIPFDFKLKNNFLDLKLEERVVSDILSDKVISGKDVSFNTIKNNYENIRHVEKIGRDYLSFFAGRHNHIVLKKKELLQERSTGHMLIHGDILNASERVMSSTSYMYGLFSSHVVLGNVNFNKFSSNARNFLNVSKISGLRIYLKNKDKYDLLGIPSYYEMGGNYAKYIYILKGDKIEVVTYADVDGLCEKISLKSDKNHDYIITSQLVLGEREYEHDVKLEIKHGKIISKFKADTMAGITYPEISYQMSLDKEHEILDDSHLFSEGSGENLLVLKVDDKTDFKVTISGSFDHHHSDIADAEICLHKTDDFIDDLLNDIRFIHKDYQNELDKLSDILYWYAYDALIHYSSPHGLEQYNGAAWGTRDVCQGPVELFSATNKFKLVRGILIKLFSRQFIEDYDFPQWFMFDRYYKIQAHDSHGDIIIWPIKAIADYLKATGDYSILDEDVSYFSKNINDYLGSDKIIVHLKNQIEAIKKTFIKDTFLPAYGGGDWDDTLQPSNKELTSKMVSGWTVALLYQAVNSLSDSIYEYDGKYAVELKLLSERILTDYEDHIIADGIPAGFVIFNDNGTKEYLLHPRDNKTGLKYRLLPFTRSMIAGMTDDKKRKLYLDIIDKNLKFPDGVRLMNDTITYKGGINTYFMRAETAANFGREIGLQYCHAHIRYIEALSAVKKHDEAYNALFVINPIMIKETVPNAKLRQSNVYFSSSDASVRDRYEAKKKFHLLKSGKLEVKGGWRLYSSGPGIYINQLITNVFGIDTNKGELMLKPVIINKLSGLRINYKHFDDELTIEYNSDGSPEIIGNTDK